METIAITEWNGVVSPLYDAACCWRIVRHDGGSDTSSVKTLSLIDKSERCVAEGITVMMCGAISAHARSLLEERGIRVIPWICGTVTSVIETFRNGGEVTVRFAMPGCRGRCGGGRRRRRRYRSVNESKERDGFYENSNYGNGQ